MPGDPRPHGYLTASTVQNMPWTPDFEVLSEPKKQVHLRHQSATAINCLMDKARELNTFPALGKKRDEQWPIVGAKFHVTIERSATSLFGIIGRGSHMTAFTRSSSGIKFWIPQRNLNKSNYPGMFDNTVAGAVEAGEDPFNCLVREASEEAAMPEDFVRKNARPGGTVTWFNVSSSKKGGGAGLMNPGILFVYDFEVSEDVVFKPVDDDIHAFHLMDLEEVRAALASQRFKPECAAVLIDFFVRHGYITAENEPDYVELVSRLHRRLPFPTSSTARV